MLRNLVMVIVLLAMLCSCSMVLAASYSCDDNACCKPESMYCCRLAPYSCDDNTRHIEICLDLSKAWYDAFIVGDKQKADSIYKIIDKYNNHLVSDKDAITVIQQAKQ